MYGAVLVELGAPDSDDSAGVGNEVLGWVASGREVEVRDQEANDDRGLRERGRGRGR